MEGLQGGGSSVPPVAYHSNRPDDARKGIIGRVEANRRRTHGLLPLLGLALLCAAAPAVRIPLEKLPFIPADARAGGRIDIRPVLRNAIREVTTEAVSIAGPFRHEEPARADAELLWLFLDGAAALHTRGRTFVVGAETIARAPLGWTWTIEVPNGATLRALRVLKQLSPADRAELAKFPENNAAPHVMRFADCPAYGEAIKSSKTTSRTLLPANFVPRVAIGTVETSGPDVVGAHSHPMLEQLFLGLADNDITVIADNARANLTAFSILHIPLGSHHGAEVAAGKKLRYVWMDFFNTTEGQEWLKTHRPLEPDKRP